MAKQNNSLATNGESKHDILTMIDIGVPFLMLQKVFCLNISCLESCKAEGFCLNPKQTNLL